MNALLEALNDYTIDNRGDVGSWVREAAMEGIERCTYILCQLPSKVGQGYTVEEQGIKALSGSGVSGSDIDSQDGLTDEEMGVQVIGGLAKQAVEKIDRVRDFAGRILQRLLHNPIVPATYIPHLEDLKHIVQDDAIINWSVSASNLPPLFIRSFGTCPFVYEEVLCTCSLSCRLQDQKSCVPCTAFALC
jgi:hypothetical protein